MRILVCIKQVPDTAEVRIDPETNTLIREGVAAIVNPFDAFAIEEGVRLRERCGGTVTVLSMGPPQVEKSLRDAIALGADEAVLVSDRAFAGADTWATSLTLAKAVETLGADLVLCGKQAIDGDTAQVGPGIAAHLDWPQVCYVSKIVSIEPETATAERILDTGYETIAVTLPAVFTVVKEINEPRLPSLRGKIRARRAAVPVWTNERLALDPARIGLNGSPTAVEKIFSPPPRAAGERIVAPTPREQARELLTRLRAGGIV